MDHLPKPDQPFYPPLRIPCLTRDPWTYDSRGFQTFPERKHFTLEVLLAGPSLQHTAGDILAFLQGWLFFGFVEEIFGVCGIRVVTEDFIGWTQDGDRILTTEILPQLVIAWENCERGAPEDTRRQHLSAIDRILSHSLQTMYQLAAAPWLHTPGVYPPETNSPLSSNADFNPTCIILSLVVLGEAMVFARQTVYKNRQLRVPVATGGEVFPRWPSLHCLDSWLLAAGWCPFEVATMRDELDNSCCYYLSMFDRTTEAPAHSSCTSSICVLNNIQQGSYQSYHVTKTCHCPHLSSESPDQLEVSSILATGHTPLVTVVAGQDHEAGTLKVISSKKDGITGAVVHKWKKMERENNSSWAVKNRGSRPIIPYVAISHAWRGGLGNTRANALPYCQLKRIQELVNKLYRPEVGQIPFWIDTLCVPLDPAHRRLAIRKMKEVYQEAEKVLVLDAFLESSNISSSAPENLMRIRSCSWMQRLWTFQEGILAQSLHFQFSGASIRGEELLEGMTRDQKRYLSETKKSVDEILTTRVKGWKVVGGRAVKTYLTKYNPWTDKNPPRHDTIAAEARRSYKTVRLSNSYDTRTLVKKKHAEEVLSQLSHSLQWRRTSRTEDEALVLANLLGLNLRDLIDVRAEITMARVFESLLSIPVDVLFLPREHLRDMGCSWMPKSLLNAEGHRALGPTKGIRTCEGLLVRLPGLIWEHSLSISLGSGTLLHVGGGKVYMIHAMFIEADMHAVELDSTRLDYGGVDRFAVILQRPLAEWTAVLGALVKILSQNSNSKQLSVRWLGVVRVQPKKHESGNDTTNCAAVTEQEWVVK